MIEMIESLPIIHQIMIGDLGALNFTDSQAKKKQITSSQAASCGRALRSGSEPEQEAEMYRGSDGDGFRMEVTNTGISVTDDWEIHGSGDFSHEIGTVGSRKFRAFR